VERSGGYGVLTNEAHMIKTTRQRTLKAGTWDLVCCPPSSLRGVFRDYPSTGRQDRWRISDTSVLPLSGPDRGSVIRDRPLCSIWTILEPHSPRVRVSGHSPYAAGRLSLHLPLGFETTTVRVTVHSLLGSAFYGAFLGKVIVVRSGAFPGWALPVAGALLFAIFFGLWATSSLYLFSRNPLTL